jgi:uncharacterized membrane protein YozB (DUF420 family)
VDPKLWFWTFALLNMAAVVALAMRGVRAIRAGEVAKHRRSMTTAGWLVVGFLGSFVVQRIALGPENFALWSDAARLNLRVHESFVTWLLVGGGTALVLGRRLARTRRVTQRAEDPAADAALLRRHRRLGWSAVIASVLGFATACGILAGMFGRAG